MDGNKYTVQKGKTPHQVCSQSSLPMGRAILRQYPINVHPESHKSPTSSSNPVLCLTMTSQGMDFKQSGSDVSIQQLPNSGGVTTVWVHIPHLQLYRLPWRQNLSETEKQPDLDLLLLALPFVHLPFHDRGFLTGKASRGLVSLPLG